jgi:hypothetical protein
MNNVISLATRLYYKVITSFIFDNHTQDQFMKNISNFYRAFSIKDKICLEKNVPIEMRLSFSTNLNETDNITFSKNRDINNTTNLVLSFQNEVQNDITFQEYQIEKLLIFMV